MLKIFLFFLSYSFAITPTSTVNKEYIYSQKTPIYTYEIVKTYPHPKGRFTEGLVLNDGFLYESCGLYKKSTLYKTDIKNNKLIKSKKIAENYFSEGITIIDDFVYMLTYVSNKGFVFDKNSFKTIKEFNIPSQGWGLTNNGKTLIMSDGSSALTFLDINTFKPIKQLFVTHGEKNIGYLNELEYVDGKIYANIWYSDFIAVIEEEEGKIISWIDLSNLSKESKKDPSFVLNGIAYNSETKNLIVTGKEWKKLYEIKLILKTK